MSLDPTKSNTIIKVLIPVKIGSYGGQQEQWQAFDKEYEIAVNGDTVVLTSSSSIDKQQISFSMTDFQIAVSMFKDLSSSKRSFNNGY